ncbi:T9SS type B sorting domain-containing protein [Flavobacterium sp. MAH-1]|uniref:T9SS type B sorting domain-containing protein n=1 Tax=Flavobacterium agri TaxID=2743471 RepID=A0A7Y9C6K5_9FLAO|nr:T9SS type B sorting domain-containing protein [Flavobacterium agri]NUY80433.1 T9SS type B sorting domain-containing protein [Flavobacterium agri]NYA70458.1 T9SS type B sorting domain-containing protein [Flavobacterium agri]
MSRIRTKFAFFLLLISVSNYAQLGFCTGSKGEPIFTENFGNGSTYGPALPAGTTTYPFVTGAPNDGQYTLFYHSNLYSTWHYSLDHTPDATNGTNGKMLLMNANATTSGDFYKKTVSGLCINTTFEFSAWLMNVYNPNTNYCGAGQIPINVRFEIWNAAETVLLGSGNTGNIMGSPAPLWQQFALVFTTVNETSVVLKMKNNGLGGCGNDLAIDDISFSACADLTTVSSPSVAGSTYTTCNNPTSLELHASTAGGSPYFYQWQTSTDNINWTDIPTATNPTYTTPNLSSLTYFRVRAAQDQANLSNVFCSTLSNVFTIDVLASPNPATSNGNQTICSNEAIPALSVTPSAGSGVNWYDSSTGGILLQSNSISYTPTTAGTYYAEAYNLTTNCIASPRTAVTLAIVPLPSATISATASVCSGNTATVSFSGTPGAIVTYTVNGGANQTATLNGSGLANITTPVLTSDSTYTLVSCASPSLSTCSNGINQSITIVVNDSPTASISGNTLVCNGTPATINFNGTPNAIVTYSVNAGGNQAVALNSSGNASVVIPSITTSTVFVLVDVAPASGTGCNQSLSQTLTISPVSLPTASISASPLAVCSGQNSTISFSGTPNAIITYKVDGGTNQTITLNASGSANITTSALTANTTYTLVSAASAALNTCTAVLNGSVTIAVNSLPTASISSNSPVCHGSSAVVTFTGTPNASVTYSVGGGANQSIVLNASGNASITIPSVTSAITYALVDVTSAAANACTKTLSQSINISSVSLPTASISANPSTVCSGQTSAVDFTGTPNAIVTYSVDGGTNQTITLNSSGLASITTNPLSTNVAYQLVGVAQAGTGCSQALSNSAVVSINPTPDVTYNGDLTYCEGESIQINLSSGIAGTTFDWTVAQSGTSGATSGNGNQIAQNVTLTSAASGTVTYTVTPFYNGCSGSPVNIVVTIHPLPVPTIIDGVICTTSSSPTNQFYTLDTNLNPAQHSFQWFFGGNPIPNAFGSTYNATQIGTYTVIATNAAGCASNPVDAVVSMMPQGESLVVEHSAAFSDNPTVAVTVIGGGGPFLYQLDDAGFQQSNAFHDVAEGTHTITVIDENCTHLTSTVTIINYPKYFTPNGDGFHDTWNIKGLEAVIYIFDRYGKLIKQISPDGLGWDGTYNGRPLPSTDYWFTIDYAENGKSKTFRAHFAMKR